MVISEKQASDNGRIIPLWTALAELANIRGKKGLRVVGDVGTYFAHGLGVTLFIMKVS